MCTSPTGLTLHPYLTGLNTFSRLVSMYTKLVILPNNKVLIRLVTIPFSCLVTCEGDIEYTGCDDTEHIGLRPEHFPYGLLARRSWRGEVGRMFLML